jgi:CHASE2 domain-containing sensor protein
MDPTIAAYVVLLALTLGLTGSLRAEREHCGRGILIVSTLSGFLVVAAVSALLNAGSAVSLILSTVAVFFSAQAAATAFLLLHQEVRSEPPDEIDEQDLLDEEDRERICHRDHARDEEGA